MNYVIIIDSIVVIVVMIEIEQVENGSFQNQTESPLARRLPRRAGRQGPPLWEGLKCIHIINVHVCMYLYCNSNYSSGSNPSFTVIALKSEASC